MSLVNAVLKGERLALARLLTQVENDTPAGQAALNELFPHTGQAHLIGVTGPPGSGKSSLVNHLAAALRKETNRSVGIIAVDPSSPFTGGALLGDRVRMRSLAGDRGVFIRSMAARGALGGLARSTAAVAQVLDAAGFHFILIETVGAGQSEVDIARLAHTTLVVEAPGLGDDIQAIKAGILEIADILVVNKADRPGVENAERALRAMLTLANPGRKSSGELAWSPPVLRTVASLGQGIDELVKAIFAHVQYLHDSGDWQAREQERIRSNLDDLVRSTLVARWQRQLVPEHYQQVLERLCRRDISPYLAVELLLNLEK
ncbi:MAG TPA: methylmalonyl Co-A mutase-associated GTPase MeaB [Levilinea sp.]|nr:methylmalonyl Co-A mutase-associated GTPase MeaB [Levilinea sp.]